LAWKRADCEDAPRARSRRLGQVGRRSDAAASLRSIGHCVKSLRSSYTGLYPQKVDLAMLGLLLNGAELCHPRRTTGRRHSKPLHLSAVKMLLEHRTDASAQTREGWTPAKVAAERGHHRVATMPKAEATRRGTCLAFATGQEAGGVDGLRFTVSVYGFGLRFTVYGVRFTVQG